MNLGEEENKYFREEDREREREKHTCDIWVKI